MTNSPSFKNEYCCLLKGFLQAAIFVSACRQPRYFVRPS